MNNPILIFGLALIILGILAALHIPPIFLLGILGVFIILAVSTGAISQTIFLSIIGVLGLAIIIRVVTGHNNTDN